MGTFSVRGSEGVYVYEFDQATATFRRVQAMPGPASPSYIELHPNGKYLYSVNRGSLAGSSPLGSIESLAIDAHSGQLLKKNSVSSLGEGPCHVAVDPLGRFLVVSHYVSGTLVIFSLKRDGSIGSMTDSVRFVGSGPNKERQTSPHIHSATFVPSINSFLVADLGTDRIYHYALNKRGELVPGLPPFVQLNAGAGPRHMAIHPKQDKIYVAEELTSTVGVLSLTKNQLAVVRDTIRALPVDFKESNRAADIHVTPDGKYLYASQRGHNSLSIFEIRDDGVPLFAGLQNSEGKTPRNFLITADGEFVLVANQDSDNIVAFRRDVKTGALTKVSEVAVPSPVCLKMIERKK